MGSSELEILEIISSVGQARSLYIEAIQEAKSKNYGQCNELVRKGIVYISDLFRRKPEEIRWI